MGFRVTLNRDDLDAITSAVNLAIEEYANMGWDDHIERANRAHEKIAKAFYREVNRHATPLEDFIAKEVG